MEAMLRYIDSSFLIVMNDLDLVFSVFVLLIDAWFQ